MIYLASPYDHPDPRVRDDREHAASLWAARNPEVHYFSPLTHGVRLEKLNPGAVTDWIERDLQYLRFCSELHVLCLPGWYTSKGVNIEIETASLLSIPVKYLNINSVKVLREAFYAFNPTPQESQ